MLMSNIPGGLGTFFVMKGNLLGIPVLRFTLVISEAEALLGLPSPPGALIIFLMSVWFPLALKLSVCPLQLPGILITKCSELLSCLSFLAQDCINCQSCFHMFYASPQKSSIVSQ